MKALVILAALVLVVYWLGVAVVALIAGVLLGIGAVVLLLIRFAIRVTDYMD